MEVNKMKTTKAILPALLLVTMALALPSAQANPIVDPDIAHPGVEVKNGPGFHECDDQFGSDLYDCYSVDSENGSTCYTEWRDDDADQHYDDANATVEQQTCVHTRIVNIAYA